MVKLQVGWLLWSKENPCPRKVLLFHGGMVRPFSNLRCLNSLADDLTQVFRFSCMEILRTHSTCLCGLQRKCIPVESEFYSFIRKILVRRREVNLHECRSLTIPFLPGFKSVMSILLIRTSISKLKTWFPYTRHEKGCNRNDLKTRHFNDILDFHVQSVLHAYLELVFRKRFLRRHLTVHLYQRQNLQLASSSSCRSSRFGRGPCWFRNGGTLSDLQVCPVNPQDNIFQTRLSDWVAIFDVIGILFQ